jgi:C4-dicarboxylate-specific signal transduction histidine kinase
MPMPWRVGSSPKKGDRIKQVRVVQGGNASCTHRFNSLAENGCHRINQPKRADRPLRWIEGALVGTLQKRDLVPKSHQTDAQKLRQLEAALEQCERFGLANRYVSAIMHEVNNPLEAITNLVYITKTHRDDPAIVAENMETIEQQLAVLSKVTSQALAFHRKEVEAKEWDLVAIAESALKLHAAKIARHRATTHTRFDGHAPVRVMGTEILQVLSNLILNALDALPSAANSCPREDSWKVRPYRHRRQRERNPCAYSSASL